MTSERIDLVLTTSDGWELIRYLDMVFPDIKGKVLTSLELRINGAPIVRIPFAIHGPSTLHTICSVEDESVRSVEW